MADVQLESCHRLQSRLRLLLCSRDRARPLQAKVCPHLHSRTPGRAAQHEAERPGEDRDRMEKRVCLFDGRSMGKMGPEADHRICDARSLGQSEVELSLPDQVS